MKQKQTNLYKIAAVILGSFCFVQLVHALPLITQGSQAWNAGYYLNDNLVQGGANPVTTDYSISVLHLAPGKENLSLAFTAYTTYLSVEQVQEAFQNAGSIDPSKLNGQAWQANIGFGVGNVIMQGDQGSVPGNGMTIYLVPNNGGNDCNSCYPLLANQPTWALSSQFNPNPAPVAAVSTLNSSQGNVPGNNLSGAQAVGAEGARWYQLTPTMLPLNPLYGLPWNQPINQSAQKYAQKINCGCQMPWGAPSLENMMGDGLVFGRQRPVYQTAPSGYLQLLFPTIILYANTASGSSDETAIVIGLSKQGANPVTIHCDTYNSQTGPSKPHWSFPGTSDGTELPPFPEYMLSSGDKLAYEFMLDIEPNMGSPVGFIGYVNCKDVTRQTARAYIASWSASPATSNGPTYPVAQINKGAGLGSFSWRLDTSGAWPQMYEVAYNATQDRLAAA